MAALESFVRDPLFTGACEARGAVIDGGTDSGVPRLIGQARTRLGSLAGVGSPTHEVSAAAPANRPAARVPVPVLVRLATVGPSRSSAKPSWRGPGRGAGPVRPAAIRRVAVSRSVRSFTARRSRPRRRPAAASWTPAAANSAALAVAARRCRAVAGAGSAEPAGRLADLE
jgi:hypothetical protein